MNFSQALRSRIVLLSTLFFICAAFSIEAVSQENGQLREGGHPTAIRISRRADRLLDLVKKNGEIFPEVAPDKLGLAIESLKIYVICLDEAEQDPIRDQPCGRAETPEHSPVAAALFHVGDEALYVVHHIWRKLNSLDKNLVLAHELFEIMGLEGNEHTVSSRLVDFPQMSLPLLGDCRDKMPVFSINANQFDHFVYDEAISHANLEFRQLGYSSYFAGNVAELQPPNVNGGYLTIDMNKFHFPESWEVKIKVYYREPNDPAKFLLFSGVSKDHRNHVTAISEAIQSMGLPQCAALIE